jgi:streptogramin lyase
MTLDGRMRQAGESVRRYADAEVDPVAMLWRLRTHERRRSAQTAAVALALLTGLVAAAVLVVRAPRQPEVLARLGRVAATIALPQAPLPRVVGGVADGLVWVDGGDATAIGVDPQRNRVARTLRLPAGSRLAAVGSGSLWLTNQSAGTVSQADPGSGAILQTVNVGPVPGPPNEEGLRLAMDGDTVWVVRSDLDVVRIDAARGTIAKRFTSPRPGHAQIAAGQGAFMTVNFEPNRAFQRDPRTGKATATIPLGGWPWGVAYGEGSFWVVAQDYTLTRIDPARRRVVATIALDGQHLPASVVVGDGAVWVFASGLLQRIDPAGNRVVHTLQVGPQASDSGRLAVGGGAVWLSDAQAHTLIRIDPQG